MSKPMRKRRNPRITCELEWSVDFGYGPIEYHPCPHPATHKMRDQSNFFVTTFETSHPRQIKICTLHARKYAGVERIYRFRFIPRDR